MPLSVIGEGVIPIFYFLLEKHDKKSFKDCLSKFFEDVRYLRDHTATHHKKKVAPYQVITDMSLVIFQPCIGMNRKEIWQTSVEISNHDEFGKVTFCPDFPWLSVDFYHCFYKKYWESTFRGQTLGPEKEYQMCFLIACTRL